MDQASCLNSYLGPVERKASPWIHVVGQNLGLGGILDVISYFGFDSFSSYTGFGVGWWWYGNTHLMLYSLLGHNIACLLLAIHDDKRIMWKSIWSWVGLNHINLFIYHVRHERILMNVYQWHGRMTSMDHCEYYDKTETILCVEWLYNGRHVWVELGVIEHDVEWFRLDIRVWMDQNLTCHAGIRRLWFKITIWSLWKDPILRFSTPDPDNRGYNCCY